MPWPNNHVAKYRKHSASRQAIVTINGHDLYLGPHGTKTSKAEYDRLIGEWLAAGRSSLHRPKCALTGVELCARYFKFAKSYYRKNGTQTDALAGLKCALRYVRKYYGSQPAAEFGLWRLRHCENV